MAADLKTCVEFLKALGIDSIPHTKKTYIGHLVAVHRDLQRWGCEEDVCLAGLFHSIYGTQQFQGFTLPRARRGDVRDLIGARAEFLAYVNCAMDRPTLDRHLQTSGPYVIRDRLTDEEMELNEADYDDVCRVHLCDYLEQVERAGSWHNRFDAYRNMAHRLGGVALEEYEKVAANAPTEALAAQA